MLRACTALAVAVAVALGTAATPAAAETFRAAVDATNTTPPCTETEPCPLDVAMGAATSDDDTVALGRGVYDLDALAGDAVQNAGALQPAYGAFVTIGGTRPLAFAGTVMRDLTFDTAGARALDLIGGVAERIVVIHQGRNAVLPAEADAVDVAFGGLLRDSVVIEHGDDAAAVDADSTDPSRPSVVENVTAIATGARSVGVRARQLNCAPQVSRTVVRNTIARGTLGDLGTRVTGEDGTCHAAVSLDADTTNYRTIARSPNAVSTLVLGAGNQTTPAQTDATLFDDDRYHQASTSPTIDAGATDASTGTIDLDADARVIDGRPDIGADEMIAAPTVATAPGAPVSLGVGELRGTAVPGPGTTVVGARFDWGRTAAYGSSVEAVDAGGGAFTAPLRGVTPGATVHDRFVATVTSMNQRRTVVGSDTTLAFPAPPLPPAPPPALSRPRLRAASVIGLTAPSRRCSAKRSLTVRLAAPKGARIARAAITLRGKTTIYSGRRLKARYTLRGLPTRRFGVKVTVTLDDGRTATLRRTYGRCRRAKAIASSGVATSPA